MLKGEWVISMSDLIDFAGKYINLNAEGGGNIPHDDLIKYLEQCEVLCAGERVKEEN